eukprot:1019579-Heterocapsa_arctica.AAC.1
MGDGAARQPVLPARGVGEQRRRRDSDGDRCDSGVTDTEHSGVLPDHGDDSTAEAQVRIRVSSADGRGYGDDFTAEAQVRT